MKINLKKIVFPEDMKDKINSYIKRKDVDVTYIEGCLAEFEYCNLNAIEPHRIIIKTKQNELVVLYYGNYSENKNQFYLYDLSTPISWTSLRELTRELA